jgi:predicted permease
MSVLWQDLRYGARMLLKNPVFAAISVVTLALGIGANTAIFSLLDALMLKPLSAVVAPEQLVWIGRTYDGRGFDSSSYANYRDHRDQNTTLAGLAVESRQQFHLGTDKTAERISGALVSGNYFDVLGVKAAAGRLLQPSESEVEGANPVAVISERLWRRLFGAEQSVIGQKISLNSHPYTIVGVVAGFKGTSSLGEKTDVWIPVTMWRHGNPWMASIGVDWLNSRSSTFLDWFGRLKPGVTVAKAQADLSGIAQRLAETYPETNGKTGVKVVAGLGLTPDDRGEVAVFTGIQMGVVALVLLIACANIAGLLLARTAGRQKEIGIRLALGAGRWRIVRQLLTESTMLSLVGGAIGAVIALWLNDWLHAALPDQFNGQNMEIEFALDARVLGFTLVLSLLTGILFGLAPALQVSKPDLIRVLKDARRSFGRGNRTRLRNALVVGQIALSLVLVISAGLCVRTLRNARAIDVGFKYENLLTAKVDLGRQSYSEEQGRTFYSQLLERAAGLPGVESASLALTVPLKGGSYGTSIALDNQKDINIRYNIVTPSYLDTMGIPLLLGRGIAQQDSERAPRVAIINETFASRAFPNENPVGKHFKWKDGKAELPIEVIGVARDTKAANLFQNTSYMAYLPLAQKYDGGMTLHLRTNTKPEQLVAAVQREISALDKSLPIYSVKTLEQYLGAALFQQRIQATLISAFALLAVLLATIGLYGVLSYSVTQRTQEIGIRMALGAQRLDVLRLIIGQGVKLVALGLVLGLTCALAFTRVLRSLLYGVSTTDPLTFAVTAALLTVVALLACYLPAHRATKLEPSAALRYE